MELEHIMDFERSKLVEIMQTVGMEFQGDDIDDDEMRALLYSFVSTHSYFSKSFELCCFFDLPFELVNSLIESNEGKLTETVLGALLELTSSPVSFLPLSQDSCDSLIKVKEGVRCVVVEEDCEETCESQLVVKSVGESCSTLLPPLHFGHNAIHTARYSSADALLSAHSYDVFSSSAVYSYCMSLDRLLDRIFNGWEGNWDSELEAAVLELLVAVDNDFVPVVIQMSDMMGGMMSGGAEKEMESMLSVIQEDVSAALTSHSAYAIGRLHQTLLQLNEMESGPMGSMITMPSSLLHAMENFYQIKIKVSPQNILSRELNSLIISAELYMQHLRTIKSDGATSHSQLDQEMRKIQSFLWTFSSRVSAISSLKEEIMSQQTFISSSDEGSILRSLLHRCKVESSLFYPVDENLLDALDTKLSTQEILSTEELSAIHALRPSQLSAFMQAVPEGGQCQFTSFMPVLPLTHITDSSKLDNFVDFQSECLVQDVITVDSLLGYYIGRAGDRSTTCALLSCMLNAGLSYVLSHSSKLMGLFPCMRAMLILSDCITAHDPFGSTSESRGNCAPLLRPVISKQLLKRLKDMPRIFRNKIQKRLSLRLNSDLHGAIAKLRAHHGDDCWVGEDLELSWKLMASTSPPMLMVFELWYGDDMIAADFAHPVCGGKSVYVATRFFDRSADFKTLQPGFLLALAECAFLRRQGCLLWDLGGVNLCPLMRYKNDLTGEAYSRHDAMHIFRSVRDMPQPSKMLEIPSSGILVEEISFDSLSIT